MFLGFACQSNEINVSITRYYTSWAYEESLYVYKGTSSSGPQVFSLTGSSSGTYYYSLCMERGQTYYITLHDSYGDAWSSDSYVSFSYNGNSIFYGHLSSSYSDAYTFSIPYYCEVDGEWPTTEGGHQATISCPIDYEGSRSRQCYYVNGDSVAWNTPVDTCTLRAPVISYPQSSYSFKKNIAVSVIPTTQYRIDSYSIEPALPEGLSFDTSNGQITGTPLNSTSFATSYTITASNSEKSTSTTISIEVVTLYCEAEVNGLKPNMVSKSL